MPSTVIKVISVLSLLIFSIHCFALTKEQEADSYLLKAQKAYKEGDFKEAVWAFENIEQLNVNMVDDFHFFYAMALNKIDEAERSWNEVNLYLTKTGRSGNYYQKALDLHQTLIDKRKQNARKYITSINKEKSGWSEFRKDYSVRYTLQKWLAKQATRSEELIDKNDIDGAIKIAEDALQESSEYKDKVKQRYPLVKPFKKEYEEVKLAYEMKLISTDFSVIQDQYTAVLKAYEELDFKDFDLYFKIASKRMNKEYPIAKQMLDNSKSEHRAKVIEIKKLLKCKSLKSKVDGYNRVDINYRKKSTEAEYNYSSTCRG